MARARISDILALASDMKSIPIRVIKSPERTRELSKVRWAIGYVARKHGHSLPEIGRILRRDHSTISHGLEQVSVFRRRDAAYDAFVADLYERSMTVVPFHEPAVVFDFIASKADPAKAPVITTRVKPKNDFTTDDSESDNTLGFHVGIVIGSQRLAEAIALARAA